MFGGAFRGTNSPVNFSEAGGGQVITGFGYVIIGGSFPGVGFQKALDVTWTV